MCDVRESGTDHVPEVKPIRAAGGVVWRPNPDDAGSPRIALVHRPRYDDWSLPKGKLEPGEHPLLAAVREVFEETAVRAVPQALLPPVRYLVAQRNAPGGKVDKIVEYWSMRAWSWQPRVGDHEVDVVRWVTPPEAVRLLTYSREQAVLGAFVAQPLVTGVVGVVRHARAAPRDRHGGPDDERPLTPEGTSDADAITPLLAPLRPGRLVSATPWRCAQTLAPLAALSGTKIETDSRFDDGADVATAAEALRTLAGAGTPSLVCGQGRLIPAVLGLLAEQSPEEFRTRKGNGWLAAFAGARLIAASTLRPGRP